VNPLVRLISAASYARVAIVANSAHCYLGSESLCRLAPLMELALRLSGPGAHMREIGLARRRRLYFVVCGIVASAICVSEAPAQADGTVAGTVLDTAGVPLLGVEITVDSSPLRSVSDERGVFHLLGVSPGVRTLNARRLGFLPGHQKVEVSLASEATVTLRLVPVAATLPPVVVRPTHMNYTGRLAGYYERLERKSAGYFITRDQIDHENPRMLGQLLQHVPGVMATRGRGGITGIRLRGRSCWPLVWIDGTPMPSGEVDLDSFSPSTIQGIELYLGSTTAPARYSYSRDVSSCGTILLWSRGPDTDPIRPFPQSANLEQLVAQRAIFNADQVDQRAYLDTTQSVDPTFPQPLFAAGIQGLVVAEFVVDTAGRVEDGTVDIISSTAAPFTDAVRAALPSASFIPAVKNGHAVRQLVQQPFEFSVDRRTK
jgi:TonB family protein